MICTFLLVQSVSSTHNRKGEGVGGGVNRGNDLGGGLGEEAVEGLRPGRRNVGLCVTVWGVVEGWQRFVLG